jgi:hypothetical protein
MTSPSTRLEGDLVTVGERPVSAGTVDILFLLAFFVHRNPFIALRTGRRDEHFSMSGKELLRMPGQSLGVVGLLKGAAQQVVAALGPLPITCWSGLSAGYTTTCPASPALGSNGWCGMSSASAAG